MKIQNIQGWNIVISVANRVNHGGYDLEIYSIDETADALRLIIMIPAPGSLCVVTDTIETVGHTIRVLKFENQLFMSCTIWKIQV